MPTDLMNTPAFGAYVERLRNDILKLTKDQFAEEHGALSRTDQNRIEGGANDVPLTEVRIGRTARALTKADPYRFPEEHTEGFLTAVAATCAASVYDQEETDEQGTTVGAERAEVILEHARNWDNNPGVLIGARANGLDGLITGRALMSATEWDGMITAQVKPVATFWAEEANRSKALFADIATTIAARQHGVATTCPTRDPISAKATEYWPQISRGTVQRRADRRLDPLRGPMTMSAARRRAWALGATTTDIFSVACVVFLANAVAAAWPDLTPLQAWLQVRGNDVARMGLREGANVPFVVAYEKTKKQLPAEYLPHYDELHLMLHAAESCLTRYLDSVHEPLWDMTIRVVDDAADGDALAIDVDTNKDGGPYVPAADDLLIYEQDLIESTVRDVVADMGVPTLELRSHSVGRTGAEADDPMYFWCPVPGLNHRYAVLYEKSTKTWTPTHLF
ncbi:hypothetical protein [Mycobacteroides abscessus]|uniref:hypothetical protein n=1 Tax=Mycobacteroides abscessus TaxID=36809 RepID=UPI001055BBEA|nr:hypothetical protein [Mycobacteroides abscessus]